MTIPPDYFELRDAAEGILAEPGKSEPMVMVPASRVAALRKALAAGDERNGIEVVAGDKTWPHRQAQRNIGHIALALDGGMKETT